MRRLSPNESKKKQKKDDGTVVIDLHADEVLETTAGMNTADILHYQIDVFKKTMAEYKNKQGPEDHLHRWKGEGVLRQAIVHELNLPLQSLFSYQGRFIPGSMAAWKLILLLKLFFFF